MSEGYRTLDSVEVWRGHVIAVRRDQVQMPSGDVHERDVVEHPGAVHVLAFDDQDRVLLIRQYRHPVGRHLLELPAGLLDVAGEPASATGARELAEEAGLAAAEWHHLIDVLPTPGGSNEATRVFLARGISAAPAAGFTAEGEEADLTLSWHPLDEAVEMVLSGELTNGTASAAILAAAALAARGWAGLRPAAQPWPDRPTHAG
ncbi:MAG TPA: NUDIX hydrolase [Mycobacteriales bacterium]|nr:NUDIX hydrolase [Mycobacteriales bacterium]